MKLTKFIGKTQREPHKDAKQPEIRRCKCEKCGYYDWYPSCPCSGRLKKDSHS